MSRENSCNPLPTLIKELERWYRTPLGQVLLTQEQHALEQLLPGLFGYYLLYVGHSRVLEQALSCSRVCNLVSLLPDTRGANGSCDVAGDAITLPFASASLDIVVLSHTLDFSSDPHAVLREVERVLIPGGRLIILGFNSLSLWGLWRLFHHRRRRVPWCGRFLSLTRLEDWLSLLGFEVETVERTLFIPPLQHAGLIKRLAAAEQLGRRYWSILSGGYAVQAVKRVSTLTPIEPAWKLRSRVLGGGVVEPTVRSSSRGYGSE